MNRENTFNFASGPAVMPDEVLIKAQSEMLNYGGSGMSVMEMSHRSKWFQDIIDGAEERFRKLLNVPDSHAVLFLQGGATTQFAAIPMNLMKNGEADYAVTGHFSNKAAKEAEKYGRVNRVFDSYPENNRIPRQEELTCTPGADYFYYCANNTIFGTEWNYTPEASAPLVCDMSSDIMTKPVDVSKYSLIYAGAQKNMAPAGLTLVIVDKSVLGHAKPYIPEILDYSIMTRSGSMLNTPPCWCIYMFGLVMEWIEKNGGIKEMEARKIARAGKLYDFLDNSSFYATHALPGSRSDMNITFRTRSDETDAEFVAGANARGLFNLKGHRVAGGLRASLYNAMPMAGVDALIDYMKEFEKTHV